MKQLKLGFNLHGLQAQVLLWTVLPLTILLIIFAFSGVSSHQASMRSLAVEENSRLVDALARLLAAEIENYAWQHNLSPEAVTASELDLANLLALEHPHGVSMVVLLDTSGQILYRRGSLPSAAAILDWPGVSEALVGERGVLFSSESSHGDIVAYAPIPNRSWTLLIRESWHSLTDPLIRFEQVIPFVLFTATAISLLTLFFGLISVVRPLRELGLRANQIALGRFDAVAGSVGGVKEIEDLRLTLNEVSLQLQNHQEALQDYLRAVTQAQEEERARLGRELHDETVQTLIALGHKAQMVQRGFERGSEQTAEHISQLRSMVAEAIEELRRFSQALHPHYLQELGLLTALELLAREMEAEFSSSGEAIALEAEQELALYRIAQEALNNARRHAQAEHIGLEIQFQENRVQLLVRDDGIGFALPKRIRDFTQQGHFGLMGMRERAQLLGAQLELESAGGKGTRVCFVLKP